MNMIPALTAPHPEALANVKEQICHLVVAEGSRHFGDRLQAVILTGSMARDEATFQTRASGFEVLGDAEFVLVFRHLPERAAIERFILDAQIACAAEHITCKIDCSAVRPGYFQSLRPSTYAYELLTRGQVCGGDGQIFSDAPRFSANEIPHEHAWRMLCNRMIELLEVLPEERAAALTSEVDYRALKLKLDLATSILVFAGLYQPGYEERARIFREHCSEVSARVGISLAQFTTELEECTLSKLGRVPIPRFDRAQLQRVVRLALDVCTWELHEMVGEDAATRDFESWIQSWIDRQSLRTKVRGWAFVARSQGWLTSWKQWPRWSRMALGASPRYWIYTAALRVARQFASGDTGENASQACELPLSPGALRSQEALRQEIARNYRECVVRTNS